MAKFLKLNKAYQINHLLDNPDFDEYGPEAVTNGDFSDGITGWSPADSGSHISISDGELKVTNRDSTASMATTSVTIVDGKTYSVTYKSSQGNSSSAISSMGFGSTAGNMSLSGQSTAISFDSNGVHTHTWLATLSGVVYFTLKIDSTTEDDYMLFDDVSIKESGDVQTVENGWFSGVVNGAISDSYPTDQWDTYIPGGVPTTSAIESEKLTIDTAFTNSGAALSVPTVSGAEYRLTIDSVTKISGNDLGPATVNINLIGNVDCTDGSADFVFTAVGDTSTIYFRAGNNNSGKVTYKGISVTATNKFANDWTRASSGVSESGNMFDFNFANNTLTMSSPTDSVYVMKNTGAVTSGENYAVNFNVRSISGTPTVQIYNGSTYLTVIPKEGDNKFLFDMGGSGAQDLSFGIKSDDSADYIILNSIDLSLIKNQPKLIGIDTITRVDAPDTNTVDLLYTNTPSGSDFLSITYDGESASSVFQMRNFFQDSITRLSAFSDTNKILNINPPVDIEDIIAG